MQLPVLLYHHVGPARPGQFASLTVSPRNFERQVRWLARHGYVGIRPSDCLAWFREGTPLPEKPVLLTFDDGYADLAEYALPVLRRYNFGGVIFVVTQQVGKENAWDAGATSVPHQLMTAGQIREWAAQGIEFGAHSRTHPDLTTVNGDQLRQQVEGSQNDLTSILGIRVISFAYPYGSWNRNVCDCVKGAFDLAFTTGKGLNHLQTDRYLLRRTMVGADDSLVELAFRVRLGWNPLKELRARIRLRSRLRWLARVIFQRRLVFTAKSSVK